MYDSKDIRTGNMPSRRDADMAFKGEVSITKQSDAEGCDVNYIMKRFERTGMLEHLNSAPGRYEDLGDSISYQEALNRVMAAETAFEALPARIRARFENDPAQLLDFIADGRNREEAIALGLIEQPQGQAGVDPALAGSGGADQAPAAPAAPPGGNFPSPKGRG